MPAMLRRVRLVHIIVLIPALVLSAACSRGQSGSRADATLTPIEAPPPVTITWSFWGDAWEEAVNRRVVRAFERDHPGIQVQIVHHPWDTYFDWLKGEWQAGRSPDVMFLNYIPAYAATGELEPIDRYVKREGEPLDDFYPALLNSFRADDKLYGLPRDNDTKVIFYNRAHFAAAGIPEPSAGWTWSDLRNAALALTRRDVLSTRYGFGFEPQFWWLVWLWQNGGDVLDDPLNPQTVRLDSPQNAQALQFLQDLVYVDRVTPPLTQLNTDDMSRLFREGRLSMLFGNHALVPPLAETAGLSWDVAPLPRAATGANVAGGAGYVISHRSTNKDAAWQLVRFLTSRKGEALFAESGVITPARRSVREDNIFLRRQPYHADVFLAETELGRTVPNFPGVTEIDRAINAGLAPLWRGERTAVDVLRDLAPRVQQLITAAGTSR
jgi:multiple sugar transport system substrate-binding protein